MHDAFSQSVADARKGRSQSVGGSGQVGESQMMAAESPYAVRDTLSATQRSHVLRAVDSRDGRPVILKLLPESRPGPERLGRLRREYTLLRKLDLDGAPRPLGFEPLRQSAMLVMADHGATSTDRLLAHGPVALDTALRWGRGAARVLGELHAHAVVHKDLNPSNMVVEPNAGNVELIDFGLAAEGAREEVASAVPSALEGTLAYLAPEQTGRMNRSIDYRADFYALGASLFEWLAGRPPFVDTDRLALVHQHLAVEAPRLDSLRSDVPPALAAIVARLLAKTPEARYQSAAALDRDLQRCEASLAAGEVAAFTPGRDDIPLGLQIPQTLYGRADARARLEAAFARARSGAAVLTLVTGAPGMGKSALVHELYTPVTAAGAWFVRGKFDQFQRDRPYTAILQAFQELIDQLLAEAGATVAAWGDHLAAALGANAGVLVQMLPDLARIVGEHGEPPALDAASERHRFHQTLIAFFRALAGPEHPLVLFIDDLQWADRASLNLLHAVLKDPDLGDLHIVGAYRDEAVDADHALAKLRERLAAAGVEPEELHLTGLAEGDVAQLVADALQTQPARCGELVDLLMAKTWGNPFFVEHLLQAWYRDGLLWPDPAAGCWRWDAERLAQAEIADNVVALVRGKLTAFPEATQGMLARAAVLGARFDLAELAAVAGTPPAEAVATLQPALDEGYLRPLDEHYKFVGEAGHSGSAWLRFAHDRLQAAALELLPAERRAATHLAAGRRLRAALGDPDQDERLFAVVTHLNAAAERLTDQTERRDLAELDLVASRRSKRAGAADQARQMAETGLALLGEAAWQSGDPLALALVEQAGLAAYLQADFNAVASYTGRGLAAAERASDVVDLWRLRILSAGTRGDLAGALADGLAALAALGEPIPDAPKPQHWAALKRKTRAALARHSPATQAERAQVGDPGVAGAMRLMAELVPMAIQQGHPAFAVVIQRHVQLAWQHGNDASTCWAVATFCIGLMRATGAVAEVGRFADLAIRLADDPASERYRPNAYFVVAAFVDIWRYGMAQHLARLAQARDSSEQSGNLDHLGYSTYFLGRSHEFAGATLPDLQARRARYDRQLAKWELGEYRNWLRLWREAGALLQDRYAEPTRFQAGYVDEDELGELAAAEANVHARFSAGYNKVRLGIHYRDSEAIAAWRPSLLSGLHINYGNFELFPALALDVVGLGLLRHWRGEALDAADKRHLRADRRDLAAWHACLAEPVYADPWLALADGIWHWLARGALSDALGAWERAAARAAHAGLGEPAGLAWELAGEALAAAGCPELARPHRTEAVAAFEAWGAAGKAAFLRARYALPEPAEQHPGTRTRTQSTDSSSDSGSADLDLEASMRAAQTIAEEIQPEALVEKLMRVVAQTAGATHGYLLLGQAEDSLQPEARLDVDREPTIATARDESWADTVPHGLIRYSARRLAPVGVEDRPAGLERFSDEPVLTEHGALSALALPLVHRGELAGVLYLEHRRSRYAFSQGRSNLLNLLSTQMAIALENAALYRDMERQVAERTAELERLASTDLQTGAWRRHHFLAEAKRSFDYARRTGSSLAVIMLDIDRFKTINDVYGHEGGDRVLEALSEVCLAAKRSHDSFGRLGGEEFALLLPDTDGGGAVTVAERLRRRVAETELALTRTGGGSDAPDRPERVWVTLSLGVASLGPEDETADSVIQRADEALYQAKNAGRDRVQTAA